MIEGRNKGRLVRLFSGLGKKTLACALLCGTMASVAGQIRITCIGNSITEGAGLKHRSQESYPGVLQRILGDDFVVLNCGKSGRTLLNKGDRPYMIEPRFRKALESKPDIVTIKLGTNDTKPQNWAHHEEFKGNLNQMIDSLEALPSHPFIYLCLPVPPVGVCWGINDSIVYNGVIPYIQEVAAERHLSVIDLYTPLKPFPELFADSIHPNRAGACIIAEEIARRILLDVERGVIKHKNRHWIKRWRHRK